MGTYQDLSMDSSPEKAGVGGSIPSLATFFSTAYKAPLRHFHSISFQNYGAGVFARSGMREVVLEWLASRFRLFSWTEGADSASLI
jgi:hypothetical protein